MSLTKEEAEKSMEKAWKKFSGKYPLISSTKFFPRLLSFVLKPQSMKEVFTNGYYLGWLEAIEPAQKLCQIYFEIAEEVLGEDEVRKRRDAKMKEVCHD